jgi:hypothetical protein
VTGVLLILPALGIIMTPASLYCLYLLSLGFPALMMKSDKEKALPYTAIVVVAPLSSP